MNIVNIVNIVDAVDAADATIVLDERKVKEGRRKERKKKEGFGSACLPRLSKTREQLLILLSVLGALPY